jgi:hypothetical protein
MLTPTVLWTKKFFVNLGEAVTATFATGFLGSLAASGGVPNVHSVETAAWSAAAGAIAVVLHSTGVTAQTKAAAVKTP